jgi:hypothetical protein
MLFCEKIEETILFVDFPFAKNPWRIVHMTFNISPPNNITGFIWELVKWNR